MEPSRPASTGVRRYLKPCAISGCRAWHWGHWSGRNRSGVKISSAYCWAEPVKGCRICTRPPLLGAAEAIIKLFDRLDAGLVQEAQHVMPRFQPDAAGGHSTAGFQQLVAGLHLVIQFLEGRLVGQPAPPQGHHP